MESNHEISGRRKENSIAILPVVRVASFGAFLDGGTRNTADDILLHNAQQTRPVKEGERVEVFLYHDPHHRLTASMNLPKLAIGDIGYAKVLSTTRFGAFVDVGTERGIFLPFSEMIERVQEGQSIWIKLYEDKTGRLAVTMKVDKEMIRIARPIRNRKKGDVLTGTIYNLTSKGAFLITKDRELGFIYKDDIVGVLQIGAEVTGRITYIREDGHANVSMRAQKEEAIHSDMEILIDCMKKHQGILPYTDKSQPEDIRKNLHLSKAAFKRAVGHLLKLQKIVEKNGQFKLKN